jgi:hypothetical protein
MLAGLAVVAGCDGSPALKRLSASDVTGIPPGNAVGTGLSGKYLVTSATDVACACRSGSCSMIHAATGALLTVVQQDGALTIGVSSGGQLAGGVNADDTFRVGGASQGSSTAYALETGTFTLAGGQPSEMQYEADVTVMATSGSVSYDCDVRTDATATYQGP